MRLDIKNVGKIKKASVELQGITVIAGVNDTGKSTVGKALYTIFNAHYMKDKRINNERTRSVVQIIENLENEISGNVFSISDYTPQANILVNNRQLHNYSAVKSFIMKNVINNIEKGEHNIDVNQELEKAAGKILDRLLIDDEVIFDSMVNDIAKAEFVSEIKNFYSDSEESFISLEIRGLKSTILLDGAGGIACRGTLGNLRTEALYVDNPSVIDDIKRKAFPYRPFWRMNDNDHREKLILHLLNNKRENVVDGVLANEKMAEILDLLSQTADGNIRVSDDSRGVQYCTNDGKSIDINSVSAGLKTFVLIKTLILNGVIETNGTVILDEPEIHLHPEWQLVFARLIVLLNKVYHLNILLNTHSPYFLRAIEVFSEQYGVEKNCKYYLSEAEKKCTEIFDVTSNRDVIYAKLAAPLQRIENERWKNVEC